MLIFRLVFFLFNDNWINQVNWSYILVDYCMMIFSVALRSPLWVRRVMVTK